MRGEKHEEKSRILVIDDDIGLRKTLLAILDAKGYETFVAGDGAEGLALLQGNPGNLVLTDLGLPNISWRSQNPVSGHPGHHPDRQCHFRFGG